MNIKKVYELLEREKNDISLRGPDELSWQIAICMILIGNIPDAFNLFKKSFYEMLKPKAIWSLSGQANHLVDVYFLSCEFGYKNEVIKHLKEFRKIESIGDNYYANTAYGMMGLLYPELEWFSKSVEMLLAKPHLKDVFFIGNCIQALKDYDQDKLNSSLVELLTAHKGMATHGGLRETPEGWLCMPAMVLIYLAELRGMKARIENDYVSLSYIDFMISQIK